MQRWIQKHWIVSSVVVFVLYLLLVICLVGMFMSLGG